MQLSHFLKADESSVNFYIQFRAQHITKDTEELERIQKKVKRDLWGKAEGSAFSESGEKRQPVEEQNNLQYIGAH